MFHVDNSQRASHGHVWFGSGPFGLWVRIVLSAESLAQWCIVNIQYNNICSRAGITRLEERLKVEDWGICRCDSRKQIYRRTGKRINVE